MSNEMEKELKNCGYESWLDGLDGQNEPKPIVLDLAKAISGASRVFEGEDFEKSMREAA